MASSSWNSSPHPISDLRDWNNLQRLEINPAYQRGEVWSSAAKIMLIDSILSDIPMPKILVSKKIIDGSTHRIVIDGQQRTRTILEFLSNEFCLTSPYEGALKGKYFRDFSEDEANKFLSYQIDFNEASGISEDEIREVYSRLNKYTFALNKQELRRADFPGDFLDLSQRLAESEKLNEFNIFSPAVRRRLGDIEYTSELIALLVGGIQDKKKDLDSFYINYKNWNHEERESIERRFESIIEVIENLFRDRDVKQTRFRQKSDFYSLFAAIDIFNRMNVPLNETDKEIIFEVIELLDSGISPSSEVDLFKHYAVRCISDANSHSTRLWRSKFIFSMLFSPFVNVDFTEDQKRAYVSILSDLPYLHDSGMCPIAYPECSECGETKSDDENRLLVAWNIGARKTLINALWVHQACMKENEYVVIDSAELYPPYREAIHSKLFGLHDLRLSQ